MNVIVVMLVLLIISILINIFLMTTIEKERSKKNQAQNEAIKAKADLDYYLTLDSVKREVAKKNEEKIKNLNSGSIHKRNEYAASILRNK